jgi:hypothetical protein
MDNSTREDIRRLLKNFGIQADEAIMAHLERLPEGTTLQLRMTLEDLTVYPPEHTRQHPGEILHLEIEGQVRG